MTYLTMTIFLLILLIVYVYYLITYNVKKKDGNQVIILDDYKKIETAINNLIEDNFHLCNKYVDEFNVVYYSWDDIYYLTIERNQHKIHINHSITIYKTSEYYYGKPEVCVEYLCSKIDGTKYREVITQSIDGTSYIVIANKIVNRLLEIEKEIGQFNSNWIKEYYKETI